MCWSCSRGLTSPGRGAPERRSSARISFGRGEDALVEAGDEDHPEGQRAHRDERRDGDPLGRAVPARRPAEARLHQLGGDAEAHRQVGGHEGRDVDQRAERIAERRLLVAGLGEDGLGDRAPQERRVGLERRRGAARRIREGDQLPRDDPQRAGGRLEPGRQIERQHLFAVEDERALLAAPRPRQKRAQRQPPQPLLPAGPIARQVALRPDRRGRRHGRSRAPRRAPASPRDRPRGSGARRRGASPRAADPAARESRAAAPAGARPRRGSAARRGGGDRRSCAAGATPPRTPPARAAGRPARWRPGR